MTDTILKVDRLRTYFNTDEGELRAVDGVSFSVRRKAIVALVGESGCGKSVTAYSILRLIQKPGRIVDGSILLHQENQEVVDIVALPDKSDKLYEIRGGAISMIFQEPMTALSPVHTIGNQICEAILLHKRMKNSDAEDLAVEMLDKVGIPAPRERLKRYPFELSGGMRQRAMIAMALVCRPELLIADEPTTALDVTIQAQIMKLIVQLRAELGMSVLLITHDLGVVAQMADEVAVMYLGRIVESSPIRSLMKQPLHPYTMGLLKSLPSMSERHERLPSIEGSVPSLTEIPAGCPFHPRCSFAQVGRCNVGPPPTLRTLETQQEVACVRAEEIRNDS